MTMSNLMETTLTPKDYSLTGTSAACAVTTGLTAAEWYHSDVPRKTMKALMKRRDGTCNS